MKIVMLKAYRAKEISFENDVENGTKIDFENKYSYNVNYSDSNNLCRGEMQVSAISKQFPEKFYVKVKVEGIFQFNPEAKREVIHKESFKELFPYVRALVSTVSANAGIPAIILPGIDIESQSIYKYDFNKNAFGFRRDPGDNEDDNGKMPNGNGGE